jgi:hypothetical protein
MRAHSVAVVLAVVGCGRAPDIELLEPDRSARDAAPATPDATGTDPDAAPTSRDVLTQPFASTSIWNTPLGAAAVLVPAGLMPASDEPVRAAPYVVTMDASAPMIEVWTSTVGFLSGDRCVADGDLRYSVPFPSSFVVPGSPPFTAALLLQDGRTIRQTQPFARCAAGGLATTLFDYPDADLYGEGIEGANGGSGLSSLGGLLRLGELRPESGLVRHALQLQVDHRQNLWNCSVDTDCFRWPAVQADDFAVDEYGGAQPSTKMGALLALPAATTPESLGLRTEPARRLAWTLSQYGAYLVNSPGSSSVVLSVELSVNGDFRDQFASDWGFAMATSDAASDWGADWLEIAAALMVVDDNAPGVIGGAGERLQPPAPPLVEP